MIDWLINNAFGTWGPGLLDFYIANSLPINILVIAYGAFLIYLHVRVRPFRRNAVDQARTIIAKAGDIGTGHNLHTLVGRKMDWSAVAAVGEGSLIAGRWGLWPVRATADRLQKVLPIGEVCRDALADTHGPARPR